MPIQNLFDLYSQIQTFGAPALATATTLVATTESIQKIYTKLSTIFGKKEETTEEETKKEFTALVNDLKGSEINELEQYMTELLSNLNQNNTTITNTTTGNQSPIIQDIAGTVNLNYNK
jgi:dihydroxyacetone kinase